MIKKIATKLGVDRAIFYSTTTRLFAAVGGVVNVLLVATFMTGAEQGFYYTFGSILAIQIFFELGLAGIVTQFVAHEKAHLTEKSHTLIGPRRHSSRLSDLLRFCIKWYTLLAIALIIGLVLAGFLFFTSSYKGDQPIDWHLPWILLVIGTTLNFILAPISAYIEGLGKVKEIAFIRFLQAVIGYPLVWILLIAGTKLYAASVMPFVGFFTFLFFGWRKFGKLLTHIYKTEIAERVSYMTEILPLQWKIALSWVSGYFIFQIFNPVIFAYDGAVAAGQMGMTLAVLNSIGGLAMGWITTKVPIMSELIARREYPELDGLFNRTVKQLMFVITALLLMFLFVVFVLRYFHIELRGTEIADRLLPYIPMVMMMIALLVNQYTNAIATYLRCHKKEPFLLNSIVGGILCVLSTVILGKYYGVMGVSIGYCIITILLVPWGQYVYITKKRQWHR